MEETELYDFNTENIPSRAKCKKILLENENLTLIHINIRSVNKNFEELIILMQELFYLPQIIILTETWKVDNLKMYYTYNYTSYYTGKGITKSSGVIVYVRNDVNHEAEVLKIGNIKLIRIKIINLKKEIEIHAIYRSPRTNV